MKSSSLSPSLAQLQFLISPRKRLRVCVCVCVAGGGEGVGKGGGSADYPQETIS